MSKSKAKIEMPDNCDSYQKFTEKAVDELELQLAKILREGYGSEKIHLDDMFEVLSNILCHLSLSAFSGCAGGDVKKIKASVNAMIEMLVDVTEDYTHEHVVKLPGSQSTRSRH
jgi:hypothetical protein